MNNSKTVIITMLNSSEIVPVKLESPESPLFLSVKAAESAELGAKTMIASTWRSSNGKGVQK